MTTIEQVIETAILNESWRYIQDAINTLYAHGFTTEEIHKQLIFGQWLRANDPGEWVIR